MEYADFYDITAYGSDMWKGNFSQKEIACYSYEYLCEFESSKLKGRLNSTILDLVDLLKQDGSEACIE